MKLFYPYKNTVIIISLLVACIVLLVFLTRHQKQNRDNSIDIRESFAGSATCAGCHKSIYESHVLTAHYLTSRPAMKEYIKGSFEPGKNKFKFNDSVEVVMEERNNNYYQVEYVEGKANRAKRLDIVVGSGTKGQSYINWMNNRLLQLPITYFTAKSQWSNSPGYPDKVVYNRPITSRCLECHSTYVAKISDEAAEPEEFSHNRIIYGVDCEKCHGPAAQHVKFQTENPGAKNARYILNPVSFTRQQSLDMCSLCHGGRLSKTKPSFSFKPGDKLNDYFDIDSSSKNSLDIDVHGNQSGLLAASKCFRKSDMTCVTCHNSHENESGKLQIFSKRCISCHATGHNVVCKMTASLGSSITNNCIDCHMPEQPSKAIAVLLQGDKTPTSAQMRTHFIKVYPEETKKVVALMHTLNGN